MQKQRWTLSLLLVSFYSTTYRWYLTDCNVLFYSFCRIPKSASNQSSKINAPRIFCVKVALTHREKNTSPAFTRTLSRTSTSSITFHVEHYISRRAFTYHVHPCWRYGPYQTFGEFFFQINSQVISTNNNNDALLTNILKNIKFKHNEKSEINMLTRMFI